MPNAAPHSSAPRQTDRSGGEALTPEASGHLARVGEVNRLFFEAEAEAMARACWDMARRFWRGGRLLVVGGGAGDSDAYHVSVEFLHPVLVGKRALPAMVLEGDAEARIEAFARPQDIALGLSLGAAEGRVATALRAAGERGLLTLVLTGRTDGTLAEYHFAVPEDDPLVVQEVQETCYHVLYELVHVFLEQESLL